MAVTIDLGKVAPIALPAASDAVRKAWVTEQQAQARRVAMLQDYAAGDHPSDLTRPMRQLLRLSEDSPFGEFNDNYMDAIIQTMVDRCGVLGFDTAAETEQAWIEDVLKASRFDELQIDLIEGAVRDGDSYLMVWYDNEDRQTTLSHEPAFDGESGMLVYYPSRISKLPGVAVKLWPEGGDVRVNVYHADRIERYIQRENAELAPYATDDQAAVEPWADQAGRPIGVPIVPVRHRWRRRSPYGRSELESAIPLQNALNRTLYSMVMTGEMSAFPIRIARGFEPPASITPATWIKFGPLTDPNNASSPIVPPANADEAAGLAAMGAETMSQAMVTPFLDMARWLKGEISFVSRTPAPEFMGSDSASGEALKQREIGLLGKVRRFQVKAGNALEDAMRLAARVEAAYGTEAAPALEGLSCRWAEASIRNDGEVIQNALAVAERVSEREFLRMVAEVYGWDEDKIDAILAERGEDTRRGVEAAGAFLPQFNISQADVAPPAGQQTTQTRAA